MRLPAILTGPSPLVGWLNALRGACGANEITSVVGGRFTRGAWGTVITVEPPKGSVSFDFYQVTAHRSNYLVCRSWDTATKTAGTEDIYIAKPTCLRWEVTAETIDSVAYTYDTFSEANQTRVAHQDTATNDEVIVPRYLTEGDNPTLVLAVRVNGGTGVNTVGENLEDLTEEIPIDLIDLNIEGRAWAKVTA